ncbi:nucleotide exchange factor GrpE [Periweissella cryptocerci]|uniref:Protein GrpE n=1 Tax=Periweissella cryptocerci TaxID=2506420 RepID=A0A4P6YVN1_9LACO|nr:nucleotide exchange factor GrpE [Periweissella cryptocerci]QBO36864.1 nucleotide exchange factor GrpE [Periweissella cryptocerci]
MAEDNQNVEETEKTVDEATDTSKDETVEVDEALEIDPLADLQAKYDVVEDQYIRGQAEMANMNARFKKEREQLLKYEGAKLAKSILPAIDNLERALSVEADDDAAKQLKAGVEMVLKTMNKALEDNDIKVVGEIGEKFDADFHQAIQSVPADNEHAADTIVSVMQKGYVLKDRVIRPAMVSVAQ